MKSKLFFMLSMLFLVKAYSQQAERADTPLDTGMVIPGFEAYRGKLLILDFWNVSCLPCIAAFPKMQALQDQFASQVQIVLVTTDSKDKVEQLQQRSSIVRNVHLPMMMDDSTLYRRFPFASVPAHVWVDKSGTIRYLTNGYNTTAENIHAFLEGKDPNLPSKREEKDYDFNAPLMLEGGGKHLERLFYYSSLAGRMETDIAQMGVASEVDGRKTRVKATNVSILKLYEIAYGESASGIYKNKNRIQIRVSDPSRLLWPDDAALRDRWKVANTYSYEIKVKPDFADKLFDLMKGDLDRLFEIDSRIEIREMPCWILVKHDNGRLLQSAGGDWLYAPNHRLGKGAMAEINNLPISKLISLLESITYHFGIEQLPIIDETGYAENLDIQLNNRPANLSELRKFLCIYGLDLVPDVRQIEMLVLSDAH